MVANTRGGEDAPAKGFHFDIAVSHVLVALGYKPIVQHTYGLDMVAEPPKIRQDDLGLLFAPRETTAFEFKGGQGPSVESAAKKLSRKVGQIQKSKKPRLNKVRLGVLVVERFVPASTKRSVWRSNRQVWDYGTVLFVISKIRKKNELLKLTDQVKEVIIDSSTSLVYTTKLYKRAMTFVCALFYQHPFNLLDTVRFEAIIKAVTGKLTPISIGVTVPTYAVIELFSLSGIRDDVHNGFQRILEAQSAGKIIYDSAESRVWAFDTAPWSFLIK